MSKPRIEIQNPNGLFLHEQEIHILRFMFSTYYQLVIQQELKAGLNSRTFLVRPIQEDQTAILPKVAKIAPIHLIRQEWEAYHKYVYTQLPHVAEMRGELITSPDQQWGGIHYEFVGGNRSEIVNFREYWHRATQEECERLLKRLFRILEPWWQNKRIRYAFCMQSNSYSWILPDNLVVKVAKMPPDARPFYISSNNLPNPLPKKDDYVTIQDGVIRKVNLDQRSLLLDILDGGNDYPLVYQIRLWELENVESFKVGDCLSLIQGVVTANYLDLLQRYVQRIVPSLDTVSYTCTLGTLSLPNPLLALPTLLKEIRDVHIGYVHGSLNFENILVNRDSGHISLVDFALTRRDHTLHDLLRLEAEIITKLVSSLISKMELSLETLVPFYNSLHNYSLHDVQTPPPKGLENPFSLLLIVRKMVSRHLFVQDDWNEYYQALIVYLLGTLRFSNLDQEAVAPLPKQVAFFSAAVVLKILVSEDLLVDLKKTSLT